MRVKAAKIGNSRGVRIPKPLLVQYGIGDPVELEVSEEGVVLLPDTPASSKKGEIPSWKIRKPLKIKGVSLTRALLDNRNEERN